MNQLSRSSGIMRRTIGRMQNQRILLDCTMFSSMRHVAFKEIRNVGSPVSLLRMNNDYGQQSKYFKIRHPGTAFDWAT